MPLRPASSHVCGLVAAAHIGGCGCWSGFGMMLRDGMETKRPWYSNGSSVHMRGMISSDSCHMSRDCSVSISKPACSNWLERPVPNSTRPFDRMSSAATRSATRIGWLNRCGSSVTPWPSRMRFVRCETAREEHLGRRGVRELGEEVVLDLPDGVVAELVGEHDLLERLVVAAVLAALVVRLRHLELVEQVEFHRRTVCDVRAVPCKPRRGGLGCSTWPSSPFRAPRSRSTSATRRRPTRAIAATTRPTSTTRSLARTGPAAGRLADRRRLRDRLRHRESRPVRLACAGGRLLRADAGAGAREAWAGRLRLLRARGEALPVRDGRAALVTCGTSFHWLAPAPALAEFARALAPGGWVALFWRYAAPGEPSTRLVMEVLRATDSAVPPDFEQLRVHPIDPFGGSGLESVPPVVLRPCSRVHRRRLSRLHGDARVDPALRRRRPRGVPGPPARRAGRAPPGRLHGAQRGVPVPRPQARLGRCGRRRKLRPFASRKPPFRPFACQGRIERIGAP